MKVIIALVILYLANFATSYYLHKKYVASQKRVRQYGGVSTARVKGSLRKKGKIVLLAFNEEDDTITYGEKFEGITVFSKFESICFFGIPTFSHPKTISVSVFTV